MASAIESMGCDDEWLVEAADLAEKAGPSTSHHERERLQQKRERLGLAMAEGMLSPERARIEISKVDREVAQLPMDGPAVLAAGRRFASLWEAWPGADVRARTALLRILFERVRLDVAGSESR
ncbi:MAG: hypothetical protein M5U18_02520 [Dehalococcoidia bacterium]|nr:hypothetical protein [Dehalococcoidia bacterium]